MRHALMLVNSKGDGAVDHANKMSEKMQDAGDEDGQAVWNKIARQVELLVYENPSD